MRASEMAEGSAHDAHTPAGATRLAGGPSPPASLPSGTGARPVIQTPFTPLTRQDIIGNACRANWSRLPRLARASLALKARSLLLELRREIPGARPVSCTRRLRVTNPALRCQSLTGMTGADGWICTSCLRVTDALHISMCFNGENGTHGVSRTLATRLRRAGAENPSAWVWIGTREWSRATAIRVRSTVPEIPRATGMMVVVLGVEPSRSR